MTFLLTNSNSRRISDSFIGNPLGISISVFSLKMFLQIRSSKEWNVITAILPLLFKRFNACVKLFSKTSSSSLCFDIITLFTEKIKLSDAGRHSGRSRTGHQIYRNAVQDTS